MANLVGYVIGPSGMNWLIFQFLQKEGSCSYLLPLFGETNILETNMLFMFFLGLPTLGGMFLTFYVGTKVER